MGDPGKQRKKFKTPRHPWEESRLEKGRELRDKYAFKNRKELLKVDSILTKFKERTKNLVARRDDQARRELQDLFERVAQLGLTDKNPSADDILGLEIEDVIERRLQTVLVRRKLARTMSQARQFITHGHITVEGKKITSPSYLVDLSEESSVAFVEGSPFAKKSHPERISDEELKSGEKKTSEKKEEEKSEKKEKDKRSKKKSKSKKSKKSEKAEKKKSKNKKSKKKSKKKKSKKSKDKDKKSKKKKSSKKKSKSKKSKKSKKKKKSNSKKSKDKKSKKEKKKKKDKKGEKKNKKSKKSKKSKTKKKKKTKDKDKEDKEDKDEDKKSKKSKSKSKKEKKE